MAPFSSLAQCCCLILLLLGLSTRLVVVVEANNGGPAFFRQLTSVATRSFGTTRRHECPQPGNPFSSRYTRRSKGCLASLQDSKDDDEEEEDSDKQDDNASPVTLHENSSRFPPRGGQDVSGANGMDTFVSTVTSVTNILVQAGSLVLPPVVAVARTIVGFYRALPKDAIVAQVGLVYCFAGGYYPTLFSSLQAAQQYGWNVMVEAIEDLAEEAIRAIEALEADEAMNQQSNKYFGMDKINGADFGRSFRQKTGVVMATVDPMKINQAAGALYMTWVGVKSVLEQEYARVITLSLTMARYIERVARFILAPPAHFIVADKYHQWVPVVIGWGCKAAAMNIAWRIQRIMTAATSAVTGGLLFARAIARMLSKRGIRLFGLIREDDESTFLDEIIGFLVAGLGFYTQFESQWRSGFSFRVPFPLSLITWPFDWAEKWIQWQITK